MELCRAPESTRQYVSKSACNSEPDPRQGYPRDVILDVPTSETAGPPLVEMEEKLGCSVAYFYIPLVLGSFYIVTQQPRKGPLSAGVSERKPKVIASTGAGPLKAYMAHTVCANQWMPNSGPWAVMLDRPEVIFRLREHSGSPK